MSAVPTQSPPSLEGAIKRLALPWGELCFIGTSIVLVPLLGSLLALLDPPGSRGESFGWALVLGGTYAVTGVVLGVPLLALTLRGWLSRVAVRREPWSLALLQAGIAALVALPLPLALLLSGGEDPSALTVVAGCAFYAGPAIVAAALAGLLSRWAASDPRRASRLTIAGAAAVGIMLVAALIAQFMPLFLA